MKKVYINPEMEVVKLLTSATILAGSGEGVANGQSVGNGYNSSDVSYSSEFGGSDNEDW